MLLGASLPVMPTPPLAVGLPIALAVLGEPDLEEAQADDPDAADADQQDRRHLPAEAADESDKRDAGENEHHGGQPQQRPHASGHAALTSPSAGATGGAAG
jgi:hypothetical protein